MFPWSAVFSLEPKVPGQRTAEELVTNTLMLELGAMVKRTERIRLERVTKEGRRRRSSSSADYSWLATAPTHQPYELTPQDLIELQDLCARVPPSQCGPVIVRWDFVPYPCQRVYTTHILNVSGRSWKWIHDHSQQVLMSSK